MLDANDVNRKSWIAVPDESDFPIQNLPFGIFSTPHAHPAVASRIGDTLIDLNALAQLGFLNEIHTDLPDSLHQPVLNDFIALGQPVWRLVRNQLANLFDRNNSHLRENHGACRKVLYPVEEVQLHLPLQIGDYTDFYSSMEHATNVGKMFRNPEQALLPNWKHLPVGYHGRASSIVVSGAAIHRPQGQLLPAGSETPVFGPSKWVDFELEMAFVSGRKTRLGESIPVDDAEAAIFGMVIFNDLSARDIQKWEYVPLGPFLGKNFGSVISPWVVTLDALQAFRCAAPPQDSPLLPYLNASDRATFDIELEVALQPDNGREYPLCHSNFKYLYWTMPQQLAHHTSNGCNVNVGDLYASGTISGPTPDSFGSMLELSWKGTQPIPLEADMNRIFLQDRDTVIMRAYSRLNGLRIGFGECRTTILPVFKPVE